MRTQSSGAAFFLPLAMLLVGCSAQGHGDAAEPVASPAAKNEQAPTPDTTPPPRTPGDFLDRAERAMAAEKGWTFRVRGSEVLILQGQRSAATYKSTVNRTQEPLALHASGATLSKGRSKPEQIYAIGGEVYVRAGSAAWKRGPASDPEMQNKVEDLVAATAEFVQYADQDAHAVQLTKSAGTVQLRVHVASQKLSAVRDRPYVKKAVRELRPILEQLRNAGVAAAENQLTLDRLEETLVLNPTTYRVISHRFRFTFLIPYNGRSITYSQDVTEGSLETFSGEIALPAGAN